MTGSELPAASTVAAPVRHRRASAVVLAVWAALLVAGFAVVFTLGSPIPTSGQQRANAYDPLPLPVTEQAVLDAAERIVKLDFSRYAGAPRTVRRGTSQGDEIWTVTYSRSDPVGGVRITVSGKTGSIRASQFP